MLSGSLIFFHGDADENAVKIVINPGQIGIEDCTESILGQELDAIIGFGDESDRRTRPLSEVPL